MNQQTASSGGQHGLYSHHRAEACNPSKQRAIMPILCKASFNAVMAVLALVLLVAVPLTAQAEEYKLGVQDRLRVYVAEWPALSGEVVVGADGDIALPMIGQITASGLDTAQLGDLIAERLMAAEKLVDLPNTAVEVIAYRPFYILGNVMTPGEYAYRPGMLVLNALSIAGGLYRAPGRSEWDIEQVAISSQGEMSVLDLRRQDLLAEQIRLTAERDAATSFPPTPADADASLLRALEEQQRIFDGNLQRRRSAETSLATSIANREQEIASIDQQVADVATKRAATEAELEQVRDLAKRDLAVQRVFPLEQTLADVLREQQELAIGRLRAEQGLNDLRRELNALDEQRQTDLQAESQRVNAQIREVDEQRAALARLLDGAAFYSSELADDNDEASTPLLRYVIVRAQGDTITELDAEETTRVLPGDIVKVTRSGTTATAPPSPSAALR